MTDGNDTQEATATGGGAHVRAATFIDRFGGIRPMASKLGLAVSTVQGWKQRDSIPATRLPLIRTVAAENGIDLSEDELAPVEASADAAAPPRPATQMRSPPAGAQWLVPALALAVSIAAIAYATWIGARLPGDDIASATGATGATGATDAIGANTARLDDLEQRADGLAVRLEELALTPRPPPDAEARLQRIEGALPTITAQVAAVVERPAQITARLAEIEDGLDALAQRQTSQVDAIEAADGQSAAAIASLQRSVDALRTDIASLNADFAALSSAAHGADSATVSAVGLAMATGQLRAAIATTRSFAPALAAVRALAIGDAALADALAPLDVAAATGIADLATLRQRFASVAGDVVAAARSGDDRNWVDRTLSRAASLVSVRRVGADVAGDSAEAVVARAELALQRVDVAAAVDELARLEGAGADVVGDWLAAARAHIAAVQALIELDEAVRAALAAAG